MTQKTTTIETRLSDERVDIPKEYNWTAKFSEWYIDDPLHGHGETELARVWTKVEKIRAKQAAKPKHSPLPQLIGITGLFWFLSTIRIYIIRRIFLKWQ